MFAEAWRHRDWDTLARLYMPLQEARRQRRQRCGEGTVALDLAGPIPYPALNSLFDGLHPHGDQPIYDALVKP